MPLSGSDPKLQWQIQDYPNEGAPTPPTYYYCPQRSWGKVIFLQASVILSTGGGGMHGGGHAWPGGCVWQGGMHGRGCVWLGCVHGGGHAWLGGGMCGGGHACLGGVAGGHVW